MMDNKCFIRVHTIDTKAKKNLNTTFMSPSQPKKLKYQNNKRKTSSCLNFEELAVYGDFTYSITTMWTKKRNQNIEKV